MTNISQFTSGWYFVDYRMPMLLVYEIIIGQGGICIKVVRVLHTTWEDTIEKLGESSGKSRGNLILSRRRWVKRLGYGRDKRRGNTHDNIVRLMKSDT